MPQLRALALAIDQAARRRDEAFAALSEIVQHYDHFMDRLQQAVEMQQGVVADHLQAVAMARQRVMEAETRAMGLQRLLDKRRADRTRIQNTRDQKQLDELSALQFRRLHANSENLGTS
jgi:flagellar protein FliJ